MPRQGGGSAAASSAAERPKVGGPAAAPTTEAWRIPIVSTDEDDDFEYEQIVTVRRVRKRPSGATPAPEADLVLTRSAPLAPKALRSLGTCRGRLRLTGSSSPCLAALLPSRQVQQPASLLALPPRPRWSRSGQKTVAPQKELSRIDVLPALQHHGHRRTAAGGLLDRRTPPRRGVPRRPRMDLRRRLSRRPCLVRLGRRWPSRTSRRPPLARGDAIDLPQRIGRRHAALPLGASLSRALRPLDVSAFGGLPRGIRGCCHRARLRLRRRGTSGARCSRSWGSLSRSVTRSTKGTAPQTIGSEGASPPPTPSSRRTPGRRKSSPRPGGFASLQTSTTLLSAVTTTTSTRTSTGVTRGGRTCLTISSACFATARIAKAT